MSTRQIRVAIVDDHPVALEGMRSMLASIEFAVLVGQGSSGEEAIEIARSAKPDVMITDVELPRGSGVDVVRTLTAEGSPVKVVCISGYDNREYVYGVLEAGAAGFLMKEEATRAVLESVILSVMEDDAQWMSPALARRLVHEQIARTAWTRRFAGASPTDGLSDREIEIVKYVAHGWPKESIAEVLSIAPVTVRNHKSRIFNKLGMHTRSELVVWAWEQGIVSTDDGIGPWTERRRDGG